MDRFVEIINRDAVIACSDAIINGVSASSNEWGKHNMYPNNGVVAAVIGEGFVREGKILMLQCLDDWFVPILPHGVRDIPKSEFLERLPQNLIVGKDVDGKNESAVVDSIMKTIYGD